MQAASRVSDRANGGAIKISFFDLSHILFRRRGEYFVFNWEQFLAMAF
jgi:hypothetical protein